MWVCLKVFEPTLFYCFFSFCFAMLRLRKCLCMPCLFMFLETFYGVILFCRNRASGFGNHHPSPNTHDAFKAFLAIAAKLRSIASNYLISYFHCDWMLLVEKGFVCLKNGKQYCIPFGHHHILSNFGSAHNYKHFSKL